MLKGMHMLPKLLGLKKTSETLLEVAVYLEELAKTVPEDMETRHKKYTIESLADKCRIGIQAIGEII